MFTSNKLTLGALRVTMIQRDREPLSLLTEFITAFFLRHSDSEVVPPGKFSRTWFDGFELTEWSSSSIGCNPFLGGMYVKPRPNRRDGRYLQNDRSYSLLNPGRIREGLNTRILSYLHPKADIIPLDLCTGLLDIDNAVRFALDESNRFGWRRSTLLPFRPSSVIIDGKSTINGVVFANINNWYDALIAATLTSAGLFVIDTNRQHHSMDTCALFGIFTVVQSDNNSPRLAIPIISEHLIDFDIDGYDHESRHVLLPRCSSDEFKPTTLGRPLDYSVIEELAAPDGNIIANMAFGVRLSSKDYNFLPLSGLDTIAGALDDGNALSFFRKLKWSDLGVSDNLSWGEYPEGVATFPLVEDLSDSLNSIEDDVMRVDVELGRRVYDTGR